MTTQEVRCNTTAFLLKGKVQAVKMRRYVESAARHFGLGGYVINIHFGGNDDGAVFGEAWVCDDHLNHQLKSFITWIRGEWEPAIYTNIKPTPVGTAYPELARVDQVAVLSRYDNISMKNFHKYSRFTMVRDDQEEAVLSWERRETRNRLSTALVNGDGAVRFGVTGGFPEIEISSWSEQLKS